MKAVGLLMQEHRLIERAIALMRDEGARIVRTGKADTSFLSSAADFLRTYADKCHHGKEEDILFNWALKKDLKPRHRDMLNELIEDHKVARKNVGDIILLNQEYMNGKASAADDIARILNELSEFYPRHIEKEDRHFFPESAQYFSEEEQKSMLECFFEFDRKLIHVKYLSIIEDLENREVLQG